jgi:cytochrome c oxidase cbb3-type subunit 3
MTVSFLEIWLVSLIFLTGVVILVVTLQLNAALQKLVQAPCQTDKVSLTWWKKFKGLKPLEQEHELLMEHTYDGIEELDNPTPPWFMYLFYSTVIFAVVYGFYYHVYATDNLQAGEYKAEIVVAEKAREAYMKQFANSINEDNVTLTTDAKDLTSGSTIYTTNCVACHGDKGQGGVGPNLTDKFWIHGGGIKDLFKIITHGVPQKGMIAWEKTLNPLQIQKVASFILTLQGTNPPGAKEPQGEEFKP